MSKYFTLFLTAFLLQSSLHAQTNQPTLGDSKLMFQDYYYLKEWKKALPHLLHVLKDAPNESEKYYIKGVSLYTKLMQNSADPAEIKQYQESVLDLYVQRMLIFGTNSKIQNQQLSTTYKYWIKSPGQYDSLISLMENRIEKNVKSISHANCLAYFDVLRRAKKLNMEIDDQLVLANYESISNAIQAVGDDKGYLQRIDQLISEIVPMDCATTASNFAQNMNNISYAKRLLNISINGECAENEQLEKALDLVLSREPTFELAMYASKKAMIKHQLNQTEKYLGIALGESKTKDQESEVYLQLAKTMTFKKHKKEARDYARQAIGKNNSKEAYQLIGNLYMSSFLECVGEKDIVERRSVFIAAYDQFKMANDKKNMAIAAAQFPSMEEIHFNNYELGQDLIVNCWFKEKVVLNKRSSN